MKRRSFLLGFALIALNGSMLVAQSTWDAGSPTLTAVQVTLSNDTMVVQGAGNMKNYVSTGNAPWYARVSEIHTLIIADGITSVGAYAFSSCPNLTAVAIPPSVTVIGEGAFYYCQQLTTVTIPASVVSMGDFAFYLCRSLAVVTNLQPTPQSIAANVFFLSPSMPLIRTLIVPCTSIPAYQSAPIWSSQFDSIKSITPPNHVTIAAEICYGGSYTANGFNLENQTESKIHTRSDCDSSITLTLTVHPRINTTLTVNATRLSVAQPNAVYQWIDCDNGNSDIPNATLQTFSPTVSGNYAVKVTFNNCTATSECKTFTKVGINETEVNAIAIYPNPVFDQLMVDCGTLSIKMVEISDISGKIIYNTSVITHNLINISSLSAGVYFIRIETDKGTKTEKFIKK